MQASELSQRIKKHSAPFTRAALSRCGRAQKHIPISSQVGVRGTYNRHNSYQFGGD